MDSNTNPADSDQQDRIEKVSVKDIRMDVAIQTRIEMEPQQVKAYGTAYKNGAKMPPLLVTERPGMFPSSPVYLLLDGFHRYQALLNNGEKEVDVKIINTANDATYPQLRWLGSRENLKNGLPLKQKDKRAVFRAYIKARNHRMGNALKSLREIASDLTFCTHQTISKWLQQDFPSVHRMMMKTGDVGENQAEGTGHRLVEMPDLNERGFKLFREEFLARAIAGNNNTRYALTEQIKELLSHLQEVAPCTEPEPEEF